MREVQHHAEKIVESNDGITTPEMEQFLDDIAHTTVRLAEFYDVVDLGEEAIEEIQLSILDLLADDSFPVEFEELRDDFSDPGSKAASTNVISAIAKVEVRTENEQIRKFVASIVAENRQQHYE